MLNLSTHTLLIIPLYFTTDSSLERKFLQKVKTEPTNVGRIALEPLLGALIDCNLLQSGGGGV